MNIIRNTLIIATLLFAIKSQAIVATLGYGNDCDYDLNLPQISFQQALNNSAVDELRVSRDVVVSPPNTYGLEITRPLILTGGYDNCTDAAQGVFTTSRFPNATIDAQGNGRSLYIRSFDPGVVEIKYFTFKNGSLSNNSNGSNYESGGGIYSASDNDADLVLRNVELQQNTAVSGGGIYFNQNIAGSRLYIFNSLFNGNIAYNNTGVTVTGGGAIYTGAITIIDGETLFSNNSATSSAGQSGDGGAIFVYNTSPIYIMGSNDYENIGFINNSARRVGGAIRANKLRILGHPQTVAGNLYGGNYPVNFFQNTTVDSHGGAIYVNAIGNSTGDLIVQNARFIGNSAPNASGGAVYAENSNIEISGYNPGQCWRSQGCNYFEKNQATTGGAVTAFNSISTEIKDSLFTDNSANSATSVLLNSGSAELESIVIYNEGQSATVYSNTSAIRAESTQARMRYASIIENNVTDEIFTVTGLSSGYFLSVYNSIIYNPLTAALDSTPNNAVIGYSCYLANTASATIELTAVNYPDLFVNPAMLDFRLKQTAQAIDTCDGSGFAAPTTPDMQGYYRGYDDVSIINVNGAFDAGANEYNLDYIFVDDFE